MKVAEPDTEGALVEMAAYATTAQTQRLCGKWRKVQERDAADPDDPDTPAEPRPTVIVIHDEDGIELRVRFDHVRGELVLASLERRRQGGARRTERMPPLLPGAEINPADGRPGVRRRPPRREAHHR